MSAKEHIKISGKPASTEEVLKLLDSPPKEPVFIDFQGDSGWITLQANLINHCWQVLRTLPDGSIEFAGDMLPPREAAAWWRGAADTPEWYAAQSWRRETPSRNRIAWRVILLLAVGIILVAAGIILIRIAVTGPAA